MSYMAVVSPLLPAVKIDLVLAWGLSSAGVFALLVEVSCLPKLLQQGGCIAPCVV